MPGLSAKPVIDIVLAVADSADESSYVPALEGQGFTLRVREPDWFEHRLFRLPDIDSNLHVFSFGCEEIDRMLVFRDWLRTHEDERRRYETQSANSRRVPGGTCRTTQTPNLGLCERFLAVRGKSLVWTLCQAPNTGEAAAAAVYGGSLGGLIEQFFGQGDWGPRLDSRA